jgi:hypothetical protein
MFGCQLTRETLARLWRDDLPNGGVRMDARRFFFSPHQFYLPGIRGPKTFG